jgi:hypothetical protein
MATSCRSFQASPDFYDSREIKLAHLLDVELLIGARSQVFSQEPSNQRLLIG